MMTKVGITLSGGGARGIAHIGVLEALGQLEIPLHKITGVSAGAIVGAFYSAGFDAKEMLKIIEKTNFLRLMRPVFGGQGFLNIENAESLFKQYIPHNSFEGLQKYLVVAATDLSEGTSIYFEKEGELIKPVLASSCIPVVFNPIRINGKTLVDGGVAHNLPYEPLSDCGFKIAVHVNPYNKKQKPNNMRSVLEKSLLLSIHQNAKESFSRFNIVIEPPDLIKYAPFSITKYKEIYEAGYRHTMESAEEITAIYQQFLQKQETEVLSLPSAGQTQPV